MINTNQVVNSAPNMERLNLYQSLSKYYHKEILPQTLTNSTIFEPCLGEQNITNGACQQDNNIIKLSSSEDNYKICMDITNRYNAHNTQFSNFLKSVTGTEFPQPLNFFQIQMFQHDKLIKDMDSLFTELNASIYKILENKLDTNIDLSVGRATLPNLTLERVPTEISQPQDVPEKLLTVEFEKLPKISIKNSSLPFIDDSAVALEENIPKRLKFKTQKILKRIRIIQEQPINLDSNISGRCMARNTNQGNKNVFKLITQKKKRTKLQCKETKKKNLKHANNTSSKPLESKYEFSCNHFNCDATFKTQRQKITHHTKCDYECKKEKHAVIRLIACYKDVIGSIVKKVPSEKNQQLLLSMNKVIKEFTSGREALRLEYFNCMINNYE